MTDQQIKDYVSTNFLITQIGNVCEIECNTEFDTEVREYITSKHNVWKNEKKVITVRDVNRHGVELELFLYFQKQWKGVETKITLQKNYCDILTDGQKYIAKSHEKNGINEPYEVLYNGKWIMLDDFVTLKPEHESMVFLNYRKFKDPNKKENG